MIFIPNSESKEATNIMFLQKKGNTLEKDWIYVTSATGQDILLKIVLLVWLDLERKKKEMSYYHKL